MDAGLVADILHALPWHTHAAFNPTSLRKLNNHHAIIITTIVIIIRIVIMSDFKSP